LQAVETSHLKNYTYRLPDIASHQAGIHLFQGNVDEAAQLAKNNVMPLMQARVLIAQGNPSEALVLVEQQRQQAEAKKMAGRLLLVMAVQSIALYAHGEKEKAVELLGEVLARAEPEGFIRLFVDEGEPMRLLILDFRLRIEKQAPEGHKTIEYVDKLLAAFTQPVAAPQSAIIHQKSDMIEPLSQRELKILQLIAQGLSNREIGERLFLALDTIKGHNRKIFDKLEVQSRTEAIARARELSLL